MMPSPTRFEPQKQNLQAAHEAGKHGYPSPAATSAHNYSSAEMRAWKAEMRVRCEEQYQDLL